MQAVHKDWIINHSDSTQIRKITGNLKISPLLAKVLLNRGIDTPDDAKKFLIPKHENLLKPELMLNVDAAVELIFKNIKNNQPILIFGDNDVDGITSATLLFLLLKHYNADVDFFVPNRNVDGHGFNNKTITAALKRKTPKLFIAVDCALSAINEIQQLKLQNIDVIIVDHHDQTDELPQAIVVNPKITNNDYPFKELAAVGVVYCLARAIHQHATLSDYYKKNAIAPINTTEFLDLVSLGTIADAVPLVDDNRTLVSLGLNVIRKRKRSGIAALLADIEADAAAIDEKTVSYRLAPRLNAAGRVGDPNKCVELLSVYHFKTAVDIAKELEQYNTIRQELEAGITKEAVELAAEQLRNNEPCIFITSDTWPKGLLGIISSRLLEKFNKPVFLITIDGENARLSSRAPKTFNILNALQKAETLLCDYGGHENAAGCNLKTENLPRFKQTLTQYCNENITDINSAASINIDAVVTVKDILTQWKPAFTTAMAPYGSENKEPTFMLQNVRLYHKKDISKTMTLLQCKQKYNKIILLTTKNKLENLPLNTNLDIILTPKIHRKKKTNDFILIDFKPKQNEIQKK